MKKFVVLFLCFLATSCCSKHESPNNGVTKTSLSIDSVIFTAYERNEESPVRLVQCNSIDYVSYFHFIRGNHGYFCFYYDYLESFGERYKYAYQVFTDQNILKYFDEVEGYDIDLKLVDTFTVVVDSLSYEITKFIKPQCALEDRLPSVSPESYHYINEEMGVIAIENHYRVFVANRNSAINDSVMKHISRAIIDNIEKKN